MFQVFNGGVPSVHLPHRMSGPQRAERTPAPPGRPELVADVQLRLVQGPPRKFEFPLITRSQPARSAPKQVPNFCGVEKVGPRNRKVITRRPCRQCHHSCYRCLCGGVTGWGCLVQGRASTFHSKIALLQSEIPSNNGGHYCCTTS